MSLLKILKREEPTLIEKLFNYKNKGHFGEYLVNFMLSHDNVKGYSRTLSNIYIPLKNHKDNTTEIDILFLHTTGIYVFEIKNYSGWIFGNEKSSMWTQTFPNNQKFTFLNPILQNSSHCKSLADFLNVSEDTIFSYIVFTNRCELKQIPEPSNKFFILKRERLLNSLRKFTDNQPKILSEKQIDEIYAILSPHCNATKQEKEKHIEQIQERLSVCPYCGSDLIERKGKYGNFLGCSKFPKCRYTKKLNPHT